jgi:hypothetical protein
MAKSLESAAVKSATHKPRICEIRFIHPDNGQFVVKYLDLYMDADRSRLLNTVVWAHTNKVELRIIPA